MDYDGPIDTDQFQAHLDRGWDLLSRGDTAGALVSARKSIELDAESPDAHNLLGYVLAASGNAEEALEHYRYAIDLDDTFVDAMLNAADILLRPVGDPKSALGLIEDALDLIEDEQELADALLLKVDTMLAQDNRDGARRALHRVPEASFEKNPMLEFLVGRAFFELEDLERATPRIERAAERLEGQADVAYYLGLLREKQGDPQAATIAFLRSRELDLTEPAPPWAVPTDQFESVLKSVLAGLKPSHQALLQGALVHVSDIPGPEAVADGVDPRACALFDVGVEANIEDQASGTRPRPPLLFVYQRNIERVSDDVSATREFLEEAIKHELEAASKIQTGSPKPNQAKDSEAKEREE